MKTIETLFQTIRDLVPKRDLDTLLELVITVSTQILGADRALLFLFDRRSESLVFRYGVNVEENLIEEAHEFSTSVIERAMRGEVIMTADPQEGDAFPESKSIFDYDIRMLLCAPIRTGDRLIGVIYADTRGKTTLLDGERRGFFVSFVDFIAGVIAGALDLHDKEDELSYLKQRLAEERLFPEIVGESPAIRTVKEKILRIVSVDYPVSILIMGESGTGKELIARAIHQAGSRAGKPLVVVNCAAIPPTLIESELFGHEKGAFTGALSRRQGFFEIADDGVIFLDEIGDLPLELQPKLLRSLQFGTFTRVGGRKELSVDVQVLCATSRDLQRDMKEGRFRKAFFHHLTVEIVRVPALRDRREDVLLLANHFMGLFARKMKKPVTSIEAGAQRLLQAHDFGENNVRELKNVIERAVLAAGGDAITPDEIVFSDHLLLGDGVSRPDPVADAGEDDGLIRLNVRGLARLMKESGGDDAMARRERPYYRVQALIDRELVLLALGQSGWKIKPAARLLGLSHVGMRSKLESTLEALLAETGGDLDAAARRHGIPPRFLRDRAGRPDRGDRRGNIALPDT